MKNIIFILNTVLLALLLSACGGGGGSAEDNNQEPNIENRVNIVSCDTSSSTYTTIETGDLLVKDSDNTSVDIIHDSEDSKKVCIISGDAFLIRNN